MPARVEKPELGRATLVIVRPDFGRTELATVRPELDGASPVGEMGVQPKLERLDSALLDSSEDVTRPLERIARFAKQGLGDVVTKTGAGMEYWSEGCN